MTVAINNCLLIIYIHFVNYFAGALKQSQKMLGRRFDHSGIFHNCFFIKRGCDFAVI